MEIKLSKVHFALIGIAAAMAIFVTLGIVLSDDGETKSKALHRDRRSAITKEELATSTLSSVASTTTKIVVESTIDTTPIQAFIPGATYYDAPALKTKWTESELCSNVSVEKIQELLNMTVAPAIKYSFSDSAGAKCSFNNGEGDEISYQISVSTYEKARTVDIALNKTSDPLALDNGARGVYKSSKADGFYLSLNVYGDQTNEVLVNAPDLKTGKLIATQLTNSLKTKPL